jgi:hypothetical protein
MVLQENSDKRKIIEISIKYDAGKVRDKIKIREDKIPEGEDWRHFMAQRGKKME